MAKANFVGAINKVERVTGRVVETTGLFGPVHAAVCWAEKIAMRKLAKEQQVELDKLNEELDRKKSEEIKEIIAKEYEVKDA